MSKHAEGVAVPARIKALPVEARGYPVPYFVGYLNGAPDFRVADRAKLKQAITHKRCWIRGQTLGAYLVFISQAGRWSKTICRPWDQRLRFCISAIRRHFGLPTRPA